MCDKKLYICVMQKIPQIVVKEEVDAKEFIEPEKDKVKLQPVMPEDLPVRRKRTAEMAGSYDWTSQLSEPGFCAAPVSCFKHVSFSLKSFSL